MLCAAVTRLQSWLHCTLLFVASRALSRCKHDIGTLPWLNAETLKEVPTPLFGRLVMLSAHGCSFMRLWYLIFSVPFVLGESVNAQVLVIMEEEECKELGLSFGGVKILTKLLEELK